jgi:adenylate cyclase
MKAILDKIFTLTPFKIVLAVLLLLLSFLFLDVPFLRFMELKAYDLRLLARGERPLGAQTVVVAIDEKSLSELGRWPWSRVTMARLVDALREQGVKAIGFDVIFSEPEADQEGNMLAEMAKELQKRGLYTEPLRQVWEEKKQKTQADEKLAEAIGRAARVTLGYFFHFDERDVRHLDPAEIEGVVENIASGQYPVVKLRREPARGNLYLAQAPVGNIPQIAAKAENAGFFNAFPDRDGTIRWAPLVIQYQDRYYSSLALSLLSLYLDWPEVILNLDSFGVAGIRVGNLDIPVDHAGRMLINYPGRDKMVTTYSAVDVIEGRLPPGSLKDRLVIVGATAIGIYDLRVTPFSAVSAGVNIHAAVIDNLLRRSFIVKSFWTGLFDVLIIIAVGILAVLGVSRMRAVPAFFFALAFGLFLVLANFIVFSRWQIWLNLVYPLFSLVLVYVGITVHKYLTEEREKKKIRSAFQYYLTSSVINEMLRDPSKLKLGGDKKELTVLFSDIRGFTSISESMKPEELVNFLNEYLTDMTDLVFKHEGLLDKYMGDAIMAVYGAPLDQPDHPERACLTALEMLVRLDVLRENWRKQGKQDLDIGIGISTGEMVVGNMGSQMRFDYTVMGDRVNLGSRLEGLNKAYGTRIIVSQYTHALVKDKFHFRDLDAVKVKGKALPVRIYELLGSKEASDATPEDWVRIFEEGLAHYRACRWEEAILCFQETRRRRSQDSPAAVYLARINQLRENPPPEDWDGVFTMESK